MKRGDRVKVNFLNEPPAFGSITSSADGNWYFTFWQVKLDDGRIYDVPEDALEVME